MQGASSIGAAPAASSSVGLLASVGAGLALIVIGTGLGLGLGIGLQTNDKNLTLVTIDPSLTTTAATTTVDSVYEGSLSDTSAIYGGYNQSTSDYPYEVIAVVPATNGSYTFRSTSGSNLKFLGYLYNNSFLPATPQLNLITRDDSTTGSLQFNLTSTLQAQTEYILVVTTGNETATGSFNVTATGPGTVAFTRRTITSNIVTYGTLSNNATDDTNTNSISINVEDVVRDVDGVTTTGYVNQVAMSFAVAPTINTALIYILVLDRTGSTYIFTPSTVYQIPVSSITATTGNQTYTIPRNQLPVVTGQYVGVGLGTGGGSLFISPTRNEAFLPTTTFVGLPAAAYTNQSSGAAFQYSVFSAPAVVG